MEIAKHAADANWLERTQHEAWEYPPPTALAGLEILDLTPWPNEETMIQVTFRIHQFRTAITKEAEVSELYELATAIVGQQTVAATPPGFDTTLSEPDSSGTPLAPQLSAGQHETHLQDQGVKHRTERVN